MHVGLIGGIGPAATELYYRKLVAAHNEAGKVLDLTIAHANVRELIGNIMAGEPDAQAAIFHRFATQLQAGGADYVVVTAIAGHFCIEQLMATSPIPVISALSTLQAELQRRGLRRVALLGHRVVMGTQLFGGLGDIEVVVPEGADFDAAHDAYISMGMSGQVTAAQRDLLFSIGRQLCEQKEAEAVVLVGTDMFLAFEGQDCGFPTIDSAEVHIKAILAKSLAGAANLT